MRDQRATGKEAVVGCLLGTAVGDAMGLPGGSEVSAGVQATAQWGVSGGFCLPTSAVSRATQSAASALRAR